MRNLLLVFGGLLVMAGIVSGNLWRNLRTERQANAELSTQLGEARTALGARASPVQSLAVPPPAAAPDNSAAAAVPAPASALAQVDSYFASALSASAVASLTGSGEKDLMKDPEYRKAQLTVTRMKLAQSNPGLAEALGLSDAEANHLFEVMAEQQLKLSAELSVATTSGGVSVSLSEVLRQRTAEGDPLRATLGDTRYAQYQDYQRNVRPALTQVASLGSTLTSAGQPLSESQSRALTTVLLAEQQRQRQEAAVPRPIPTSGTLRGIADSLAEANTRQEEGNRRILEASASTLSSAQLQLLREQFEQQAAARRRTIDSARDMDARRLQVPAPPGTNF